MEHDISSLSRAFREHAIQQGRRPERASDEELARCAEAICTVLLEASSESGSVAGETAPEGEDLLDALNSDIAGRLPESHVCRLWLMSRHGDYSGEIAEGLATTLQQSLWPPAAAAAYRLLADLGQRRMIAGLVAGSERLTLVQADALLEGDYLQPLDPARLQEATSTDESIYGATLLERWRALLLAEAALAQTGWTTDIEQQLASISSTSLDGEVNSLAQREHGRLAARATAALLRGKLAAGQDGREFANAPAARELPSWERGYLLGLAHWREGDGHAAEVSLRAALAHNGAQSPVRLALAAWLAQRDVDEALAVTEGCEPTHELLTVRAALLVRQGKYRDAEAALVECEAPPTPVEYCVGGEPLRYRWPAASLHFERQRRALRRSLHQHFGRWKEADRLARGEEHRTDRGLHEARELAAAQRELCSLPRDDQWRRSLLANRIQRNRHELSRAPLAGDALFFRAAALVEESPQQAKDDFQRLLRQRRWVEAERRVGGGRLLAVGDLLLQLGDAETALQAYRLAGDGAQRIDERCAAANACRSISAGADGETLARAADQLADRPWPHLLAAIALLAAGQSEAACDRIECARRVGASDRLCSVLERFCHSFDSAEEFAPEQIRELHLPPVLEAAVLLMGGAGSPAARWEAFLRVAGPNWTSFSPLDPRSATTRLLAYYCDEGRWDEAISLAEGFLRSGDGSAPAWAAWVHARRALAGALRGELIEAEEELRTAHSCLH